MSDVAPQGSDCEKFSLIVSDITDENGASMERPGDDCTDEIQNYVTSGVDV